MVNYIDIDEEGGAMDVMDYSWLSNDPPVKVEQFG